MTAIGPATHASIVSFRLHPAQITNIGPEWEDIEKTGKLDGKVAFITGGARGQGRSHAVLLAEEGADIIVVDLCDQIPTVGYPMATTEDLEETVHPVETGRRIVARKADVRDRVGLIRCGASRHR